MKEINLLTLSHHILSSYTALCRSVCQELGIPQTAFDILMFLANHRDLCTAREITEYSGIKKNLVSIHVDKLVHQGYLEREPIPSDRRQVKLILTDKALSVIDRGRRVQKYYYDTLTQDFNQKDKDRCLQYMLQLADRIDHLNQLIKDDDTLY